MKAFFKEMFEYHHYYNAELIRMVERHQTELPERSYPLVVHILNAQLIWNDRILNQPFRILPDDAAPAACLLQNDSNHRDTLRILETDALDRVVQYTNSRGEQYANTVQDILFHAANHSTHHRGQVISDLRQSGIVPFMSDYIFYKR
ncbi:MAG: DinB family protein [Saprospiraceae bacterium]